MHKISGLLVVVLFISLLLGAFQVEPHQVSADDDNNFSFTAEMVTVGDWVYHVADALDTEIVDAKYVDWGDTYEGIYVPEYHIYIMGADGNEYALAPGWGILLKWEQNPDYLNHLCAGIEYDLEDKYPSYQDFSAEELQNHLISFAASNYGGVCVGRPLTHSDMLEADPDASISFLPLIPLDNPVQLVMSPVGLSLDSVLDIDSDDNWLRAKVSPDGNYAILTYINDDEDDSYLWHAYFVMWGIGSQADMSYQVVDGTGTVLISDSSDKPFDSNQSRLVLDQDYNYVYGRGNWIEVGAYLSPDESYTAYSGLSYHLSFYMVVNNLTGEKVYPTVGTDNHLYGGWLLYGILWYPTSFFEIVYEYNEDSEDVCVPSEEFTSLEEIGEDVQGTYVYFTPNKSQKFMRVLEATSHYSAGGGNRFTDYYQACLAEAFSDVGNADYQ